MAIDRTGISSLQSGAPEIKYTGDEGPKSPTVKEMEMAGMMDSISLAFEQQNGYDISLATPEVRELFIQQWKEENFYNESRAPVQDRGDMRMASAPEMAYGGSANPTYTQKRKQQLAYGGIAGVDGRKRYGIGSFFQKAKDKFVDDIIPNEIKENPALTAATLAATTKLPIPGVEG